MWQKTIPLSLTHYSDADPNFSKEKERLQRRNIQDRIQTLSKYIDLHHTCDIGASKGYFVEELVSAGYPDTCGIEPNEAQVSAAQARNIPLYLGSSADAPALFKTHAVRNATLFHVIEHLLNPVLTIQELYDALPSGGHLVVETPDFSAYSFIKTEYRHKLVYAEHLFYFSHTNLQRFLEKCGFTIVYAGKRDFDPRHLSVEESLFRLGLLSRRGGPTFIERAVCRVLLPFRVPFSLLVQACGRSNFTLIVAKKP